MRCPECMVEGERSRVEVGGTIVTLMSHTPWYDEDGNYHEHNPNDHRTMYSCSRGHMFERHWRAKCPSGDYPPEQ